MKRCICLLCAFLVAVTAFCGCIERPASGVSSGGAATAMPDTDSSGLAAPVPCPEHDPTMEVENRNAEQPALLIAPDGFDETTGYLVGCGAAPDGDALLLQARWIVQEEERTVTYRSTDQGRSWQLTAVGKPGPRNS